MTDPLSGRDGTQALTGPDALAPPPRTARDDAVLPPTGVALSALPALPPLPAADHAADHAAVARWMDADAAEARRASDPRPWIDGETVEPGETRPGVVRDAGPARVLPRDASASPVSRPASAPRRPATERPPAPAPRDEDEGDDEPEWLRDRREEHEFRSQFGEWRAAPAPPPRAMPLSPATLLVLLVLVAIVVLMALG